MKFCGNPLSRDALVSAYFKSLQWVKLMILFYYFYTISAETSALVTLMLQLSLKFEHFQNDTFPHETSLSHIWAKPRWGETPTCSHQHISARQYIVAWQAGAANQTEWLSWQTEASAFKAVFADKVLLSVALTQYPQFSSVCFRLLTSHNGKK